jgi:hypothetical protein
MLSDWAVKARRIRLLRAATTKRRERWAADLPRDSRARMICSPLNRRAAVAMILNAGPDRAVGSGASRARQINMAVI